MNPANAALTSVILVTHNQLEYTKLCVQSIHRHTSEPYELIVVDNGSTDGTVEWAKRLGLRVEGRGQEESGPVRVTVAVNAVNRGFPAAANQGIRAASGQQILLLNNDTIVSYGWLTRMLRALYSGGWEKGDGFNLPERPEGCFAQIEPVPFFPNGMVGPVSNFVSGAQQIEVTYERRELRVMGQGPEEEGKVSRIEGRPGGAVECDLAMLDEFAAKWSEANNGQIVETNRLVGFCLLIRREVIDRIGLFDERFGIGNFEDDDFCLRARQAGFRLVIARDSFVHHFGGRTFLETGVDFGELMRRNERLFREKWAVKREWEREEVIGDQLSVIGGRELAIVSASGPQLSTLNPHLSLCMIARDNERTIGPAIEGIKPWVDEMIVVDTGSTDQTPRIAEGLGARVFHFDWCDDISAARNESIRHASGQWIFWMDTDDTIDEENGRKVRDLVRRSVNPSPQPSPPRGEGVSLPILGYLMKVRCPSAGENAETEFIEVDQVKLFRNLPPLRFEGRIHEQILMAIRRAGGTVAWTDIFVVHAHADNSPDGRTRKLDRDLRILGLDHRERPDHPFVLFNLGMTYAEAGGHEEAIGFLWQSIGRTGDDDSHLRKVYALLISSYCHLGRHVPAWETCLKGLKQFPDDAELRFRQATMLHQFGHLAEAAHAFETLLNGQEPRHLSSVDRGIKGYRARHNLALIYLDMGDLAKAELQWRLALEIAPDFHPSSRGLSDVLARQRKSAED